MSRNRLIPVVTLLVGIVVGWSVHGRSRAQARVDATTITLQPERELLIVQSEKPGNSFHLVPFAVKRGEHRETFGEGPADANQLWLVTYDDVVISCRSEQAPSQQP